MFQAFRVTAISTIISEILDMATGITNAEGHLISSGMGIPAFIGGINKAVEYLVPFCNQINSSGKKRYEIEDGDIFFLNDPFKGGMTHLNDHLFLMPILYKGELIAWCGNIAHWQDIGG